MTCKRCGGTRWLEDKIGDGGRGQVCPDCEALAVLPEPFVFTPDEVVNLEHFQTGPMHPFTCPNRGDGNHRHLLGDLGALVPTTRGWVCMFCDYTQDWAHDFMKKPGWDKAGPFGWAPYEP